MASLPAKFFINSVEMVDNTSYVSSDTRNLTYRQRKTVGQRYEFRIRSTELEQGDIKGVMAGIAAIERSNDVLTLVMPIFSESTGGTKLTSVTAIIGAFSINLSGSLTNIAIGDFFKFAGHNKVYQLTAITGQQIQFAPNLQRPVASAEQVQFSNVPFTCKIKGRPLQFNVSGDRNSATIELELVEAK